MPDTDKPDKADKKKVEFSPSNPNETNILLDSYAAHQLEGQPTLISPESIEVNTPDRGLQTFDPALVDPEVLASLQNAYGKPYGPAPERYGEQPGTVGSPSLAGIMYDQRRQ